MTDESDDREVIDPNKKAELIELCVNGILELFAQKPETFIEGSYTLAYNLYYAAYDLVEGDADLVEKLAEIFDPEVTYEYTRMWDGEISRHAPDTIKKLKELLAADVVMTYAKTSPEVAAIEAERQVLKGQLGT